MNKRFMISDENSLSPWIYVMDNEQEWDEPDGLFELMKRISKDVGGSIHAVENNFYQYTIDGVDDLIFQWDGCFGIVVICKPCKRNSTIKFLKKYL